MSEWRVVVRRPDGRRLTAVTADEKTVLLLDARTHRTTARYRGHENTVYKAAFPGIAHDPP